MTTSEVKDDIIAGVKLKKTRTNDRSVPLLKLGSAYNERPPLDSLFAEGVPKLEPIGSSGRPLSPVSQTFDIGGGKFVRGAPYYEWPEPSGCREAPGPSRSPSPPSSLHVDPARARIQHSLGSALYGNQESELLALSGDSAVKALDEIWNLLALEPLRDTTTGPQSPPFRNRLRRLLLKVAQRSNRFPTTLVLKGVQRTDQDPFAHGGFADVYRGTKDGIPVALKRPRIYSTSTEADKERKRKDFCRESLLWKNLNHKHILPFLGISEDTFRGTICMVLPWIANGSIRDYISTVQSRGELPAERFVESVDKWLYQVALGLDFLHAEGIVHGDLHCGNLLVDVDGNIRITDFGMALISDATSYNYASIHGGGVQYFKAPELFDPDQFGASSSRPTPASDVYAFGCTCVELYTGKVPFAEIPAVRVPSAVLSGQRPLRPSSADGYAMSDPMWSLTTSCWAERAPRRPSSQNVVGSLTRIILGPFGL